MAFEWQCNNLHEYKYQSKEGRNLESKIKIEVLRMFWVNRLPVDSSEH